MVKSQTDTTRESMWSVSSRFRPLYGVVFFSLFAFGIYTILSMARDCVAWRACVVEIVGHVAGMAIAAGAVSLLGGCNSRVAKGEFARSFRESARAAPPASAASRGRRRYRVAPRSPLARSSSIEALRNRCSRTRGCSMFSAWVRTLPASASRSLVVAAAPSWMAPFARSSRSRPYPPARCPRAARKSSSASHRTYRDVSCYAYS